MTTTKLTHDRLKRLLAYNPETGEFTWNENRNRSAMKGDAAGAKGSTGYIAIFINGKYYAAHNLAWFYVHGYWPIEIDHIDRIKTNNKIENLRECTRVENMRNHSTTILVEIDGESKSIREWCSLLGKKYNTVYSRISRGMDHKQAILK